MYSDDEWMLEMALQAAEQDNVRTDDLAVYLKAFNSGADLGYREGYEVGQQDAYLNLHPYSEGEDPWGD